MFFTCKLEVLILTENSRVACDGKFLLDDRKLTRKAVTCFTRTKYVKSDTWYMKRNAHFYKDK
jgi:hypothetical protein